MERCNGVSLWDFVIQYFVFDWMNRLLGVSVIGVVFLDARQLVTTQHDTNDGSDDIVCVDSLPHR